MSEGEKILQERPVFRRPILEILKDLKEHVPPRVIRRKPIFNKQKEKIGEVDYIPWYTLQKMLDYYAPGWDWQIEIIHHGDRTLIHGILTIRAAEGDFSRQSTGHEDNVVSGYGDPTSNAESMAFRRCCARFGLGLHLYEK